MNAIDVKRCSKCWKYLPLKDFGHDGTTSDNLTYRCNDCRTIVPKTDLNGSESTCKASDQNYHADTITTFIPTHLTDPDAIHP